MCCAQFQHFPHKEKEKIPTYNTKQLGKPATNKQTSTSTKQDKKNNQKKTKITPAPFKKYKKNKYMNNQNRYRALKMTGIAKIEGIGKVYAKKLSAAGIETTEKLLEAGCKAKAREELEAKTGVPQKLILEWVNLADLMRIKGIGEEYSDLLEEAGVDTVVELGNRKPENLLQKILETNKEKKLVRRPPVLKQIQKWIEEAKKLPRKVEY